MTNRGLQASRFWRLEGKAVNIFAINLKKRINICPKAALGRGKNAEHPLVFNPPLGPEIHSIGGNKQLTLVGTTGDNTSLESARFHLLPRSKWCVQF